VTSKVKRTLRRLAKTPKLVAHIQKKAKWEEGVFETIDWGSHKSSVQNSILPEKFVTKFVRDLLPTGKIVNFYKTYYEHALQIRKIAGISFSVPTQNGRNGKEN